MFYFPFFWKMWLQFNFFNASESVTFMYTQYFIENMYNAKLMQNMYF